jgi:hypothetical protein
MNSTRYDLLLGGTIDIEHLPKLECQEWNIMSLWMKQWWCMVDWYKRIQFSLELARRQRLPFTDKPQSYTNVKLNTFEHLQIHIVLPFYVLRWPSVTVNVNMVQLHVNLHNPNYKSNLVLNLQCHVLRRHDKHWVDWRIIYTSGNVLYNIV